MFPLTISVYRFWKPRQDLKVGTLRQNLRKAMKNGVYWLVPHGSHTTQHHLPKDDTAHSELGLSPGVINQENIT